MVNIEKCSSKEAAFLLYRSFWPHLMLQFVFIITCQVPDSSQNVGFISLLPLCHYLVNSLDS